MLLKFQIELFQALELVVGLSPEKVRASYFQALHADALELSRVPTDHRRLDCLATEKNELRR